MGEIVEFPNRREGCARWTPGWSHDQGAAILSARPACAVLAMALAANALPPNNGTVIGRQGSRSSATILTMGIIRTAR